MYLNLYNLKLQLQPPLKYIVLKIIMNTFMTSCTLILLFVIFDGLVRTYAFKEYEYRGGVFIKFANHDVEVSFPN